MIRNRSGSTPSGSTSCAHGRGAKSTAALLPSCQFALARDGQLAAYETVGDAGLDTRYVIFSATKAFVASAAWLLIGEGSLEIDRRVADYIPEFATNGKDVVTVEQVMLHTSGFPRAPLGPPAWADRDRRLEAFAKWRLNWEPGTAHEYHPTSAHWVLAELIERISGRDYRDFIHERVTGALGLPRVSSASRPTSRTTSPSSRCAASRRRPTSSRRSSAYRSCPSPR